ncbi:MAG TPA: VOC family protein [Myxococcaceae bacterium]|nr:VOC family protein [Myxococcaceae bacterium]
MQTLGIHHLAVKLHDLEKAIPFYRDVLGLPEQQRHHREDGSLRSVWLTVGERAFLALEALEPKDRPEADARGGEAEAPGWHLIALRIPPGAREQVVRHLASHGVEIVHRSRWTLYVRDPEGNRVGLSHHPDDAT